MSPAKKKKKKKSAKMASRSQDSRGSAEKRAKQDTTDHYGKLSTWIERHAGAMVDDPGSGLLAIGIGKKSAGPLDDDAPLCITGFVKEKLTKAQLKARGATEFAASFRAASGAAAEDQGITIDLVEAGSGFEARPAGLRVPMAQRGSYGGPRPKVDLQRPFDALRTGIGITNPAGQYPNYLTVGTLGFFVRDGQGRTFLVSNNHVVANENQAKAGDTIVQPGTLDLTNTEFQLMPTLTKLRKQLGIAKLSAWIDLRFPNAQGTPNNRVDGGLAELDTQRDVRHLAGVGLGGRLLGVAEPYRIDPATGSLVGSSRVWKAGRTTGWTEGFVKAIQVVSPVSYGAGTARFVGQIAIASTTDNGGPFSDSGDSGSAILNADHELVGLLFAGSANQTLANPIADVLSELQQALGAGPLSVVTA